MKFKLLGWTATAALTLVSANVMAQQSGNPDRLLDKAQKTVQDTGNAAQDNVNRNADANRNTDPNRALPAQQVPGQGTPQKLPDQSAQPGLNRQAPGAAGNVPPQTFAPSAAGAVQGNGAIQENLNGNTNALGGANINPALANIQPDIRWRYRQQNGRWMYWLPTNQWVVWTNNQWTPYAQAFSQPMYAQPGYTQQGGAFANQRMNGNMNQPMYGNNACNQSTSIYTGQTYPNYQGSNYQGSNYQGNGGYAQPNAGFDPYARNNQPGFGGAAPYASGYRGVPQGSAGINLNGQPGVQGQVGVGAQGQGRVVPDQQASPRTQPDENLDRNRNLPQTPKPSPSTGEKEG